MTNQKFIVEGMNHYGDSNQWMFEEVDEAIEFAKEFRMLLVEVYELTETGRRRVWQNYRQTLRVVE